jgi:hypothetical protein
MEASVKAWPAAILLIGSVALTPRSASADFPTCPPGYAFSPAYGLCYRYAYDLNDFDRGYFDQGYPLYPWFGYAPYFFGGEFGGLDRFGGFRHGFDGFVGGGHFGGRR